MCNKVPPRLTASCKELQQHRTWDASQTNSRVEAASVRALHDRWPCEATEPRFNSQQHGGRKSPFEQHRMCRVESNAASAAPGSTQLQVLEGEKTCICNGRRINAQIWCVFLWHSDALSWARWVWVSKKQTNKKKQHNFLCIVWKVMQQWDVAWCHTPALCTVNGAEVQSKSTVSGSAWVQQKLLYFT